MTSRRDFLRTSLLASGAMAIGQGTSCVPRPPLTTAPAFDLHLHPGLFGLKGTARYGGDAAVLATLAAMRQAEVHGFVSLVADGPLIQLGDNGVSVLGGYKPGEAQAEFTRQLAIARAMLPQGAARIVTSVAAFEAAQAAGVTGAWLACEGSEFLDGDAARVDVLHEAGVRSIQLVHYAPNAAGDLQTQPAQHGGLSAFGKATVKRMNERRMLIDVAHAALPTVKDVVALTQAPIMLSHSMLFVDASRVLAARTITPDHARLVASTGGVIGMWPSATNLSFDEFVDNTKRLVDVVGVDHVGLGTDMDGNLRPVLAHYRQVADWRAGLRARGFSADEVAKMAGGNALRVLRQAVG